MRVTNFTRTGCIVSDTDLHAEYLYVGDYGKENNIKASFLGYDRRIDKVVHRDVDLSEKLVVTVSTQKGCPMKCSFCDCSNMDYIGNLSAWEMVSEISTAISMSKVRHGKRLNVHFARMGEPTFNFDVIEAAKAIGRMAHGTFDEYHPVVSTMMPSANKRLVDFLEQWTALGHSGLWSGGIGLQFSINTLDEDDRNRMFNGMSRPLEEIGAIIEDLPAPRDRKYTLNFAVTSTSNLDPKLMDRYFDNDRCIVKMTPVHRTAAATESGFEIVRDFDVYERFEQPLVKDGWDVIVFVPSEEEDEDRITCGNALISAMNSEKKEDDTK